MIAHIVLFAPRQDLDDAQRLEILDSLRAASEGAASVRNVRLGRRVRHGLPGYEPAMRDDFEYFALLEFDDLEGLKTFLQHPAHAAAGRHFTASAAAALAYDYTVVSPGELAELISAAKKD